MTILVLIQNDLRLFDNPALYYAAKQDQPIIPVYVNNARIGAASRWWLVHSLEKFSLELKKHHLDLLYFEGNVTELLTQLNDKISIQAIYSNNSVLNSHLSSEIKLFYPNLLYPPSTTEREYKICAAYWRFCRQHLSPPPTPLPKPTFNPQHQHISNLVNQYPLPKLTGFPWWKKLESHWKIGETEAQKRWKQFKSDHLSQYETTRDFPALQSTSLLSPHLHFGEISIRQLWHELQQLPQSLSVEKFTNELAWREFSHQLLNHHSDLSEQPLQPQFRKFPWQYQKEWIERWQQGHTGYPIVDAGMRQLWNTGWMHNRVRMISASFLTKNLLSPWQLGEQWFFDTLVDGDMAVNATNWQWVAGCGTDNAPYFRIFNPTLQAKKFDPNGDYIRHWIPELSQIDTKNIHEPWLAKTKMTQYIEPVVDLKISRLLALEAYSMLKKL